MITIILFLFSLVIIGLFGMIPFLTVMSAAYKNGWCTEFRIVCNNDGLYAPEGKFLGIWLPAEICYRELRYAEQNVEKLLECRQRRINEQKKPKNIRNIVKTYVPEDIIANEIDRMLK